MVRARSLFTAPFVRSSPTAVAKRRDRKARPNRPAGLRFGLESLESRAMLAGVCDVTCEVIDGTLFITGGDSQDVVEIQFDASTNTVQVVGDNTVLGSFSVPSLNAIRVDGLGGDDQIDVTQGLPVRVFTDGGDGEDQLNIELSTNAAHSHGSSIFVRNIESVQQVAASTPNSNGGASNNAVLFGMFTSDSSHGGHDAASSASVSVDGESHHGVASASSLSANVVSSGDHDHGPTIVVATVKSDEKGSLDAERGSAKFDASHHGGTSSKAYGGTELAKKWCTTTLLANRLVTTLDGKPTCSLSLIHI